MVTIRGTIVDETVARAHFACDLGACRGACCTMPGGYGAPLLDEELAEIEKAFPVIRKYLSDEHLQTIESGGLVEGSAGEYTTSCFDRRACVFVTYEEGIAKCAFEKAFWKGELQWRKPISCHLFPIRVGRDGALHFESIPECSPALQRGQREEVFLSEFLKDSLIRAFGRRWYQEFLKACVTVRQRDSKHQEQAV
jgi:hypothetical protein